MKKRLLVVGGFLLFTFVRATVPRDDVEARLAYLAERISHHDVPGLAPGHPFDGEWRVIGVSDAVVAATNLALRHPEQREARATQVSQWARYLMSDEARAYETRQWQSDPLQDLDGPNGHAGYLSHVVLALDAACLLGGERDEALHETLAATLARRLEDADSGLLESYPAETYVPDNAVVAAALAQYDACLGAQRFEPLLSRWEAKLRAKWLDPDTGVLVFAPGQPSRGSGAAWNSMYLALARPALAAEQSELMWKVFGDETLFGWLGGFREWPRGKTGEGDVDSGPLIAGISPSATGYALADAALRGRVETAAILRTAELVGFTFNGRYLASPLVGDAITLAARTMTPWHAFPRAGGEPPRAAVELLAAPRVP